MFVWVGQAEFIYSFGEVRWGTCGGSGDIYVYRYPPVLNIFNGENGSPICLVVTNFIKNQERIKALCCFARTIKFELERISLQSSLS